MGKDVGEMIGGCLDVPMDALQRRQTSIEWEELTLNKGSVGAKRQKNNIERANNTGQEGGTWETHRPRHSSRCAVARTKKYRRPDCPKWSPGPQFVGGGDCLHREGERRGKVGSQRCQPHEKGGEQEDLFESTLTTRPPAPQYPRFPNPLQPQKNLEAERKQKCDFFRGSWSGKFEIT